MATKRKTIVLLLLALASVMITGCYSPTRTVRLQPVSFPDVSIPQPSVKRQGTLSIDFADSRTNKPVVGKLGGRIGANPFLVVSDGLENRLTAIFKDVLEQAGYTVVQGRQPTLEGEVREFVVYGNGWTQGAKEKIHLRLRDKQGQVLWEQFFKGEDGGIDMATGFAEKSMNVALTRLLSDVMDQITSESFYRAVQKGGATASAGR